MNGAYVEQLADSEVGVLGRRDFGDEDGGFVFERGGERVVGADVDTELAEETGTRRIGDAVDDGEEG